MPSLQPTPIDLLVGRLVLAEQFPRRGWVGVIVPDHLGHKSLVGVFTGQELRTYVNTLIHMHGEEVRRLIDAYQPPREHLVCFVNEAEARSKAEARHRILSRIG